MLVRQAWTNSFVHLVPAFVLVPSTCPPGPRILRRDFPLVHCLASWRDVDAFGIHYFLSLTLLVDLSSIGRGTESLTTPLFLFFRTLLILASGDRVGIIACHLLARAPQLLFLESCYLHLLSFSIALVSGRLSIIQWARCGPPSTRRSPVGRFCWLK